VEVEIGLGANEGDGRGDAKHVPLERKPRRRQREWSG
jgi:hypothetical protein